MKKPALSEFLIGIVAAAAFLPWYFGIGMVASLVVVLTSGSLWAVGGTLNKAYRRCGVPAVICLAFILGGQMWSLWQVAGLWVAMYAALSLGYGTPSLFPPDAGSTIGRFWYRRFSKITDPKRMKYAEIMTRTTVGAAFGLTAIILGGDWMLFPAAACGVGFAVVWHELDRGALAVLLALGLAFGAAGCADEAEASEAVVTHEWVEPMPAQVDPWKAIEAKERADADEIRRLKSIIQSREEAYEASSQPKPTPSVIVRGNRAVQLKDLDDHPIQYDSVSEPDEPRGLHGPSMGYRGPRREYTHYAGSSHVSTWKYLPSQKERR